MKTKRLGCLLWLPRRTKKWSSICIFLWNPNPREGIWAPVTIFTLTWFPNSKTFPAEWQLFYNWRTTIMSLLEVAIQSPSTAIPHSRLWMKPTIITANAIYPESWNGIAGWRNPTKIQASIQGLCSSTNPFCR